MNTDYLARNKTQITTTTRKSIGWKQLSFFIFFCLQIPFWWLLVKHDVTRALKARARFNAPVLGSDINENTDYFQEYPDITAESGQFMKRPLFLPLFLATNWMLSQTGLEYPERMYAYLSIVASACGLMMAILLLKCGWSPLQAITGAVLSIFSFSWMSTFTIPETYSLTVLAVIACLISAERLSPDRKLSWFRHATIVGLASWLYPPICGASLLVASLAKERKQWLTIVLPAVLLAAMIALAPQFFSESGGVDKQLSYLANYGSFENFGSIEHWRDVATIFAFFGFVSPVQDFVTAKGRPDWGYILSNEILMITVLAIAAAHLFLWKQIVTSNFRREWIGVGAWLFCLLLFFVLFNPREILLYASIPATLLLYCIGRVLGQRWRNSQWKNQKAVTVALAVTAVLLLCINVRSVLGL